ncbi:MAG: ABC transporter ATP-binding protein [Planctomycetes bacterium]|nr:ABC transporter ATP-binding protein [Planctomycetota bacterium]
MIEIIGLTKYYGKLAAVVNLNLTIKAGDIFGFIGPNGAGKTTTMRVLATLLKPTSGRAVIDGADVLREGQKVRRLVGYMPDFMGVYDDLKVYEYLEFFAAAFSVPRAKRRQIIEGVLELTDLTGKKGALVDSLSRGMQQRLQLARVLIHDPKVLILDEPASGLDPRARIELRELLRELKTMGKTIMISSHILSELEEMCDNVGIIEHGSLVFSGTMQEIHSRLGANRKIRIRVGTDPQRACELLMALPFVDSVDKSNEHITVTLKDGSDTVSLDNPDGAADDPLVGATAKANVAEIARSLVAGGADLLELSPEKIKLDDAFLKLTQGLVH